MSDSYEPEPSSIRDVESASATHGFLFADLRGYTSYLDRHGAVTGAALLERFRDLVRVAVSAYSGAEIRTEGDSFYVVFRSASTAVSCALEIVRTANNVDGNDEPISVGVGVHAGEAVETTGGPVGMAVNIAARLCAIAAPGEVVVSDTVRALTRGVGSAAFVRLGPRRLKGLDEPIIAYRAIPADTARDHVSRAHRVPPRFALLSIGLLLVGLAITTVALPRLVAPAITPMATNQRTANRLSTSTVEACEAREECEVPFAAPFSMSLGSDWLLRGELPDFVLFEHPEEPFGFIEAVLVVAALDPPCDTSAPQFIGEGAADVVDWLSSRPWLGHGDPRPHNIGGYLGRSLDIEVLSPDKWTCPEPNEFGVAKIFQLGAARGSMSNSHFEFGRSWGGDTGTKFRIIAIEVDGRTVTLSVGRTTDPEDFWLLAEPLLQTIEFE